MTYWQLFNSLPGAALRTDGFGRFVSCGNSTSNSVQYGIEDAIDSPSSGQALSGFTALVLKRFAAAGWNLHAAGENQAGQAVYSAKRNSTTVMLRVFGSSRPGGAFTVQGACVSAGSAASTILNAYGGSGADRYPEPEASASPIPASLTPSS
ncbi:MAG: hypothetical protein JOY82_16025 [Streptosporangiaceae bacterium]|nr:hypothetical protein [Streptosporangiaceae bacterium]MBV9856000.1 hypothetical protein [Streptosporangiaceae bacterium]